MPSAREWSYGFSGVLVWTGIKTLVWTAILLFWKQRSGFAVASILKVQALQRGDGADEGSEQQTSKLLGLFVEGVKVFKQNGRWSFSEVNLLYR